jgi:tRNA threonylcarbamoyladenosine biosynthesis protein TsaE
MSAYQEVLNQEDETAELATRLARTLLPHLINQKTIYIELLGDLGAGKTTFTRYLLKTLGVAGKIKSPTYTLCEPYSVTVDHATLHIHHFDLYRMKYPTAFTDAGLCLVEWPSQAGDTLPTPSLSIELTMQDDESRTCAITAHDEIGQGLIKNLQSS